MIESIQKYWHETMDIPAARWVIYLTILAFLLAIAIFVVAKLRGLALGSDAGPANYLGDFEKLHSEGKLNEAEFTKLKSTLRTSKTKGTDAQEEKENDRTDDPGETGSG